MPSPRFASVLGHRPTTAPLRATAWYSAGVMWVACTRHQRRKYDFCCDQRLGVEDHVVTWAKPERPEWMDEET